MWRIFHTSWSFSIETKPKEFTRAFQDAFAERPDSTILQAWRERLFFDARLEAKGIDAPSSSRWQGRDIGLVVVLSLVAGTLTKLPQLFSGFNDVRFYSRNLACIIIGALIVYFCVQRSCRMKTVGAIIGLLFGTVLYLNLLPDKSNS